MTTFLSLVTGPYVVLIRLLGVGADNERAFIFCYWVALFLFVGASLYVLQLRSRLSYGLIELALAALFIASALNSYTVALGREFVPIVGGGIFQRPPEGWLHWSGPSIASLQIAAAVYVLVRGLDNVGEGLADLSNPKWAIYWRRVFSFKRRDRTGVGMANHTIAAPPPGWGTDELSRFLENAHRNEWGTFASLPEVWGLFRDIDEAFQAGAIQSVARITAAPDPSGPLLLLAAHNHYRAALRLASSGHCMPAFPVGRAALEAALYGWYLQSHSGAAERWHNKPENGKARQEWGKEFRFSTITTKLKETNAEAAQRARHLHETAIEFGSHPNTAALYSNVNIVRLPEAGVQIQQHYLHEWDLQFGHAVKFIFEIGLIALELIAHSDTEIAKGGLSAELHSLIDRYTALVPRLNAAIVPPGPANK
jgi:hypothetical protein